MLNWINGIFRYTLPLTIVVFWFVFCILIISSILSSIVFILPVLGIVYLFDITMSEHVETVIIIGTIFLILVYSIVFVSNLDNNGIVDKISELIMYPVIGMIYIVLLYNKVRYKFGTNFSSYVEFYPLLRTNSRAPDMETKYKIAKGLYTKGFRKVSIFPSAKGHPYDYHVRFLNVYVMSSFSINAFKENLDFEWNTNVGDLMKFNKKQLTFNEFYEMIGILCDEQVMDKF